MQKVICLDTGSEISLDFETERQQEIEIEGRRMAEQIGYENANYANHAANNKRKSKIGFRAWFKKTFGKNKKKPTEERKKSLFEELQEEQPRTDVNLESFTCPICFDVVNIGMGVKLANCGHCFSLDCVQAYAQTEAKSNKLVINCPDTACSASISDFDLRILLGSKLFDIVDKKRTETVVQKGNFHMCPTPDCHCLFESLEQPDDRVDCPRCSKDHCRKCLASPAHPGLTCEQHEIVSKNSNDDKLVEKYIKKHNVRICANCGNGVEKRSGCDKMWCRCGYKFCFRCGREGATCSCTGRNHGFLQNH